MANKQVKKILKEMQKEDKEMKAMLPFAKVKRIAHMVDEQVEGMFLPHWAK